MTFFNSTERFSQVMTRYLHLPSILNATSYWEARSVQPKIESLMIRACVDVPHQSTTSSDCEIFTVYILKYLAIRRVFDFTAKNVASMRCITTFKIWKHGNNSHFGWFFLLYLCIVLFLFILWFSFAYLFCIACLRLIFGWSLSLGWLNTYSELFFYLFHVWP